MDFLLHSDRLRVYGKEAYQQRPCGVGCCGGSGPWGRPVTKATGGWSGYSHSKRPVGSRPAPPMPSSSTRLPVYSQADNQRWRGWASDHLFLKRCMLMTPGDREIHSTEGLLWRPRDSLYLHTRCGVSAAAPCSEPG